MMRVEEGSLFDDRRPSEEKQQPGKGSLFEEEPKPQKVDVDFDFDFREGDSDQSRDDDDEHDDFTSRCKGQNVSSVRARLNPRYPRESLPVKGRLYDEIVTDPWYEIHDIINYYFVRKDEADSITLDYVNNSILLHLAGPRSRPPIYDYPLAFTFPFKLDGKDIFEYGLPYKNVLLFDDDDR
ncbi:hypothetical protein PTKIN_Ptkin19aG0128000 [Pterospermum kingtungense]